MVKFCVYFILPTWLKKKKKNDGTIFLGLFLAESNLEMWYISLCIESFYFIFYFYFNIFLVVQEKGNGCF